MIPASKFLRGLFAGFGQIFAFSPLPLMLYRYRNSAHALEEDWRRIGGDVMSVFQKHGRDHDEHAR